MAISASALKSAIADELQDYGEFETAAGSFLERQLSKAVEHFGRGCGRGITWPWMIEQANISTTAGTLGPYTVPADFAGLMPQKRLHKPWSLDRYAVPPSKACITQQFHFQLVSYHLLLLVSFKGK